MYGMFYNCKKLLKLNLSNFNAPELYNIKYLFSGCLSLVSTNLSTFNSKYINQIEGMFSNCKLLKNIDISDLYTWNVKSLERMFYQCSSLESIYLNGFNSTNLQSTSYMFYQCSSLKSIYFNDFNTTNLQSASYMFYECRSIVSLNLSFFNTPQILNMTYMFYNCKNLKVLDISNFDFNKLNGQDSLLTGWFFFIYGCTKLEYVNMKYSVESNTKNYQDMIGNIKYGTKFCLNSTLVPQIEEIIIELGGVIECPDENFSFENCLFYHYYIEYEKQYKCTENLKCPNEYQLLIKNKSECISECKNDEKFKYEFQGECYKSCPIGSKETEKDSFLCFSFNDTNNIIEIEKNILEYITSNNMNDLELENKKIIYNYNNITFEIGGTKNEKLEINSTLIISNNECELKLKNYYNISLNEQLYFFKIIIPEQGKGISKLKYTYFYHLKDGNNNLVELDISICENEKVKIYNKINITGDLDKYDINSEYYNSICYS